MMSKVLKIVNFDEPSVSDILFIFNGGKSKTTSSDIEENAKTWSTKVEAEVESSWSFLNFFKIGGGASGNASLTKEGEKVVSHVVTSTIMTDYLDLLKKQEKIVTIFKGYKVYPYPDSISYYKMMTPFMVMTKGEVKIDADFTLEPSRIDEALEKGRGYYELIAEKEKERVVLRFNLEAFRNNYSISDVVKMDLTYHGIFVGTIVEESLKMKNEFSTEESDLSGYDTYNTVHNKLKVYDIILAGVVKDD